MLERSRSLDNFMGNVIQGTSQMYISIFLVLKELESFHVGKGPNQESEEETVSALE